MFRALVAAAILLAPALASAATGLQWRWADDEARTFLLSSSTELSELLMFYAENNYEARVVAFHVDVVTTCRVAGASKASWDLECTLDDVALAARSVDPNLQPILDEADERLTGATVQVRLGVDGRVRSIDLDGFDQRNPRLVRMAESLRLVLTRAFATFDLQLPRKGDDRGGVWRQGTNFVMALPSAQGTLGSMQVDSRVVKAEGSSVEIESQGRGTVSGSMISVGGEERPANQYAMVMEGSAVFDPERGVLVSRTYSVTGTPTASSAVSESGARSTYTAVAQLSLLPKGAEPPMLAPSQVMR